MSIPWSSEVRESIRMAFHAIGTHKLRSLLTILGVLVGVFSIIVVMTAIRGLQNQVETQMSRLGSDTFQVQRFPAIQVDDSIEDQERYWRRQRFRLHHGRLLADRVRLALHVGLSSDLDVGEIRSRFARTNPDISIRGMSPEAFATKNYDVAEGRAFVSGDMDGSRLVAVLGADLARKLFPQGSALGESIECKGIHYTIVGVLASRGSMFGQSMDSFIAMPLTTGLDRFGIEKSISIQVQARNSQSYADTVEETRGILRAIRKVEPGAEDDFEIVSNDSLISQFRAFTLAIRAGAAIVSSIAMIAAGIGIMNIMLVSVTERTREIGIRRALGAKKRNIMTQFILEAVVLSEIGGILGVLLGIALGNAASMALKAPAIIPWDWAFMGLLICSIVGIVFGTYPAWKAAQLDPIESLRYE